MKLLTLFLIFSILFAIFSSGFVDAKSGKNSKTHKDNKETGVDKNPRYKFKGDKEKPVNAPKSKPKQQNSKIFFIFENFIKKIFFFCSI